VIETDAGQRFANADLIVREIRITLGQLAPDCRDAVKRIRLLGPPELTRELAGEIGPRFQAMGLRVEVVGDYAADEFGATVPAGTAVSVAFSLAARHLAGGKEPFEFLPPRISPWKRISTQYASGKLQTIGAVAGVVVVLVAGGFAIQQWQLHRLNSQWTKMAATVGELTGVQDQIRQYRPWFDDSFGSLTILRELSLVFPEDGTVTAKSVEIRDQNTITCSGNARDNAALLRTLSQLRNVDGVHDVKVESIRGKAPLQFTFGFQYGTEAPHEN
jgi:Tfp pilus assembly protein PilN